MAQTAKNLPKVQENPGFDPWVGKIPGEGNSNHSSILAWKIPWTEEPGRLQSMGSQRVGHDCVASLSFLHRLKVNTVYKPQIGL